MDNALKLTRFKVTQFRSVNDSGWVEADQVTSLIGVNESGKSNLLLPLWKFNPAREGQINPIADYPRKSYNEIREAKQKPIFITAEFELSDSLAEELNVSSNQKLQGPNHVQVAKDYSGKFHVSFPTSDTVLEEQEAADVEKLVVLNLPKFIYYSNYGNLDSDIYLPQVIENFNRKDLGSKDEARARTLRVLFDYVKLKPEEIRDLGQANDNRPETTERKKERDILLQSASTKLTKDFREWWKQGGYRFRLAADGNHLKIWVSDSVRPEDVELEGRSTGLQWFLSFFLVFLSEANHSHNGCILLLDEPGLTLHPLAQRDLAAFFENLAQQNQILFSTHSPFLIEAEKLDRVRAVYVDDLGYTAVSSDLRASASSNVKAKSIFAAHAALGLSVSDVLLIGCQPVIVEGISDQFYLTAIKNLLVQAGDIKSSKELIFIPSGGVRGIRTIASIVSSKENDLPFVVLDSDQRGRDMAGKLKADLYKAEPQKVILIGDVLSLPNAEVEDLIPTNNIAKAFSRKFRPSDSDQDFEDVANATTPIVGQIAVFAKTHGLPLPEGWKVELAKEVKKRLLISDAEKAKKVWDKLFALLGTAAVDIQKPLKNLKNNIEGNA